MSAGIHAKLFQSKREGINSPSLVQYSVQLITMLYYCFLDNNDNWYLILYNNKLNISCTHIDSVYLPGADPGNNLTGFQLTHIYIIAFKLNYLCGS